ncbi:MAG: hypothetical protein KF688_04495 [Pirellulales bacterium]|nr:hypothetical protein [Pirellulales bacterium]
MKFTVRNITDDIEVAARQRALAEKKSLNAVLVDALRRGLGINGGPVKYRDLSDIAGQRLMDDETLAALEEQRRIDPEI